MPAVCARGHSLTVYLAADPFRPWRSMGREQCPCGDRPLTPDPVAPDTAFVECQSCRVPFPMGNGRRYCSDACQRTAHRDRRALAGKRSTP